MHKHMDEKEHEHEHGHEHNHEHLHEHSLSHEHDHHEDDDHDHDDNHDHDHNESDIISLLSKSHYLDKQFKNLLGKILLYTDRTILNQMIATNFCPHEWQSIEPGEKLEKKIKFIKDTVEVFFTLSNQIKVELDMAIHTKLPDLDLINCILSMPKCKRTKEDGTILRSRLS